MGKTKYGKNILTELKTKVEAPWSPEFKPEEMKKVLFLDNEIIDGAFYVECRWLWAGDWPQTKPVNDLLKPHKHTFNEVIAYFGTNYDDPYDLGGEVEIWIDGKQTITDRTFMAFVPAGTEHGPIYVRRVDKPIFHFTAGTTQLYLE